MAEYGPPPAVTNLPENRISVGDVPFVPLGAKEALDWLITTAISSQEQKPPVRLSNSYCVALAANDERYRHLLQKRDGVNFADGTPISLLMSLCLKKHVGSWVSTKVRGPSLFCTAISTVTNPNVKHFFLGSTKDNLNKIVQRAKAENPHIKISGIYSPPFGISDEELLDTCLKNLSCTEANLVWVGLGTPRQDYIATEISAKTGKMAGAVGAAFDFYAQTIPEAPLLVQKIGLEWLFRMLTEPKRLWKRYLVGNIQFMQAVVKHGLKYE